MTAIFAHRGFTGDPPGRSGWLENTVEAFVAARLAGADGVELDVRLTADAELAVHHDRVVPGLGAVTNASAAELPAHVPLLAEALAACAGIRVNVEVKHEPDADPQRRVAAAVVSVLRAAGADGVLVSSFDPASLEVVRRLLPEVPAGLLVDWRSDGATALAASRTLGCATLHPFVTQVDAGLVAAARAQGIGIHAWTVNADADLATMAALGIDAVITDRLMAAIAAVRPGSAG
jgi:glycerophosphoryl diester phosphodiesterase